MLQCKVQTIAGIQREMKYRKAPSTDRANATEATIVSFPVEARHVPGTAFFPTVYTSLHDHCVNAVSRLEAVRHSFRTPPLIH